MIFIKSWWIAVQKLTLIFLINQQRVSKTAFLPLKTEFENIHLASFTSTHSQSLPKYVLLSLNLGVLTFESLSETVSRSITGCNKNKIDKSENKPNQTKTQFQRFCLSVRLSIHNVMLFIEKILRKVKSSCAKPKMPIFVKTIFETQNLNFIIC